MKPHCRIQFSRQELAGAFGDIGTDFPLIVGVLRTTGLHVPSAFMAFGLIQIFSGLAYGIPMPVQPLKAMATIVISEKLSGDVLLGGGLAVGVVMLLLTLTGLLDWLTGVVPPCVVRGVQLGLGLQLARLALGDYIRAGDAATGYVLAFVSVVLIIIFRPYRKVPIVVFLLGGGVVWSLVAGKISGSTLIDGLGIHIPRLHIPRWPDIAGGAIALALPQIPLSLSNSVIATERLARDLFPERSIRARRIGLSYSLMNLVNPFLGGIPTCHGCGGLSGMYFFGARTGGAPVLYGLFYVALGVFFGGAFSVIVGLFPLPILGAILLFEALALMQNVRHVANEENSLFVCLLCGVSAAFLPNGYVVALVGGVILDRFLHRQAPTKR